MIKERLTTDRIKIVDRRLTEQGLLFRAEYPMNRGGIVFRIPLDLLSEKNLEDAEYIEVGDEVDIDLDNDKEVEPTVVGLRRLIQ